MAQDGATRGPGPRPFDGKREAERIGVNKGLFKKRYTEVKDAGWAENGDAVPVGSKGAPRFDFAGPELPDLCVVHVVGSPEPCGGCLWGDESRKTMSAEAKAAKQAKGPPRRSLLTQKAVLANIGACNPAPPAAYSCSGGALRKTYG